MTKLCEVCWVKHNPERPHCPKSGGPMSRRQLDLIPGWGCGTQWAPGCGFWIPENPRESYRRKFCCECKNFASHHYWVYDIETEDFGKIRVGDWFCVKCFGPLPKGRENVQKSSPNLTKPNPVRPAATKAALS